MLSISEFKNKLVSMVTQQEQRIAQTQNGEGEKAGHVNYDEPDSAVMLLADANAISLDFDDKIKTTNTDKETIAVYGDNKSVVASDGSQQIVVIGEKNNVNSKNGDDDLLILGNNNSAATGSGNSSVVFRGNNLNIVAGNGNNTISSLEFGIIAKPDGLNVPDYSNYENFLDKSQVEDIRGEVVGSKIVTKEVSRDVKVTTRATGFNADILNNLTAKGREVAQTVNFEETVPGKDFPMYVIAQGSATGEQWHIYKYQSDSNGNVTYRAYGESVSSAGDAVLKLSASDLNDNLSTVTGVQTTTVTVVTQDYEVDKLADYRLTTIAGNKNININDAGGNNKMLINGSNVNIKAGDGNNDIQVLDGLEVTDNYTEYWQENESKWRKHGDAKVDVNVTEVETESTANIFSTAVRAYDPIIVDFNKDGSVSALQGRGVDLDGDGISDGAASKGDKMLAMSDLDGNKKIDGGEVFGDQTVSPFSHQKLNAANGFEALAMIAKEAEQYTGINCINADGDVDLASLKRALNTVGVNIGFISENNVTNLEDLAHVASINVSKYANIAEGANVQTGYYTDSTGNRYKANDVWFKAGSRNA